MAPKKKSIKKLNQITNLEPLQSVEKIIEKERYQAIYLEEKNRKKIEQYSMKEIFNLKFIPFFLSLAFIAYS